MISAVIPALHPIPALVDTLTALVPAVAEGLIRDVAIAANTDTPFLSAVTEAGGSRLILAPGDRSALIRAAAAMVKCPHILVLEPGMVPIGDWIASLGDALVEIGGEKAGLIPVQSAPWLTWMAHITGRADARLGLVMSAMSLRGGERPRYMALDAVLADRRKRGLRPAAD
jgi:hypothetical protein